MGRPHSQVEHLVTMVQGLQKFLLFHVLACLGPNVLGSEIIHGELAPENSMPYMVSVQDKAQHVCGGFLISEDFVVTAAQCDVNMYTAMIVFATHNLSKVEKKVKYIVKKCKHPSYKQDGQNDIMLLKLGGKEQINRLQRIPLPASEINITENENCHVAGWGFTTTGGEFVKQLRVMDVSVINLQLCETLLPDLPANVICAGGYETDKGLCEGDSGGPLVCNGMAVGVASFRKGGNCDYPGVPNVYTEISKFLPWINDALEKKDC